MNKKDCRCCGSAELVPYLDLGMQPLANDYHRNDKTVPFFPLCVNWCSECWHSQLSEVVEKDLLFKNYLYVSGTSNTLRQHFASFASDVCRRFTGEISVLDVAANDGSLLEQFRLLGCTVMGVDPAENLREITAAKGIPVLVDYFSSSIDISSTFSVITATNVFAHVDDIKDFLLGCKKLLREDGLVVIEFPYVGNLLADCQFDTIYHEHLSYFSINSFSSLAYDVGFAVKDIVQTPIHGGSIRFYLGTGYGMVQTEEKPDVWGFSSRVAAIKQDFCSLVDGLAGKVICYGASAKGNTALNYFGRSFSYVVDDNPMKVGYYTPGSNMEIKHSSYLAEEVDDLSIILTAWNFKEEIMARVRQIRGHTRDKFITYVPGVSVI